MTAKIDGFLLFLAVLFLGCVMLGLYAQPKETLLGLAVIGVAWAMSRLAP